MGNEFVTRTGKEKKKTGVAESQVNKSGENKFPVIRVNKRYGLENGILDAGRYVLIKLLTIVRDEVKIRNIIAMNKVFFDWLKSGSFQNIKDELAFVSFQYNYDLSLIKDKKCGLEVQFGRGRFRSVFLDRQLKRGIFRMLVQIWGVGFDNSCVGLGIVETHNVTFAMKSKFGVNYRTGGGFFFVEKNSKSVYSEDFIAFFSDGTEHDTGRFTRLRNGSKVTLEINLDNCTMHCISDGRLMPYSFYELRAPVYAGCSGGDSERIHFIALLRSNRALAHDGDAEQPCGCRRRIRWSTHKDVR